MSTSHSSAAVLLDNTANQTNTLNDSGQGLYNSSTVVAIEFSIDPGYTASLSTMTLGLRERGASYGVPNFTVGLWSSGGASMLGSQNFTASGTALAYYDFTLTNSVFSNLAAGSYYLSLSSTNTFWAQLTPVVFPTAPTTGFNYVQYRRSTNSGATWSSTNASTSILLNGTVVAPVPGSGLAAIGTLGVAGVARRRRRR